MGSLMKFWIYLCQCINDLMLSHHFMRNNSNLVPFIDALQNEIAYVLEV